MRVFKPTRVPGGRLLGWLCGALFGLGIFAMAGLPAAAADKRAGKLLKKEAVFTKAAPATVLIVIPGHGKGAIGSGVIVDSSGLVLTNAHVVEMADASVQVFLYNPKEKTLANELSEYVKTHTPLKGTVLRRNRLADLALVQLPLRQASYPTIDLAEQDSLKIGQDVVAIGNPLGLTWTFTTGTVSSLRDDMIQTETPINRGNSGGPLLDLRAKLVGINTRIKRDSEQTAVFGFAIPVAVADGFLKKWRTRNDSSQEPQINLSKNPVPLLALVLRQDIDRLRQHNAKRGNTNTEQRVERDLVACEKLGAQTLEDDLTVGQVIPRLVEKFHNIAQHNSGAGDGIEQKLQQLTERAIDHLKQIAEVAK
ncbi:MAG TPA: trypsin-like peptidase domain-containing protein [Pseudomonadota bacterium]|nr:trypsin-like peptidase domain-containing protein [Pseudomonadota bacterium]HNO67392.1 trypsin-like peptidase domain-containing protein [Pseudomonadota bacterium]